MEIAWHYPLRTAILCHSQHSAVYLTLNGNSCGDIGLNYTLFHWRVIVDCCLWRYGNYVSGFNYHVFLMQMVVYLISHYSYVEILIWMYLLWPQNCYTSLRCISLKYNTGMLYTCTCIWKWSSKHCITYTITFSVLWAWRTGAGNI